jgi:hypothetical protein
MLHNLLHRHDFLTGKAGCFQFCTNKITGISQISFSPYEGSLFHPVPKSVLPEIEAFGKIRPLTPEAVMALIRNAKEN